MRSYDRKAAQLEDKLRQAQELLAGAVEEARGLRQRLEELTKASEGNVHETIEVVERLAGEQEATIHQARERGAGPGLFKVLDEAAEIDGQQRSLVNSLKTDGHDAEKRRTLLERFCELERQQQRMLLTELGKFEAQGLRPLLDNFVSLSEQQEAIIRDLMARA